MYLRQHNLDLVFLQETHCSFKAQNIWSSEWGNKCIFAHGTSNSRGVAILFTKKTASRVRDIIRDINGRYIICKMEFEGFSVCVANIYAPNHDDPQFFQNVQREIDSLECTTQIISGDFNLTLNPELDRNVQKIYHKESIVISGF